MRSKRANATDINKSPHVVRYVWVFEYQSGTVTSCTSYTAAKRNQNQAGIRRVTVLDLWKDTITHIEDDIQAQVGQMIETWRDNYFDHDWDFNWSYSVQFRS